MIPGVQSADEFATVVVELDPTRAPATIVVLSLLAPLVRSTEWNAFLPKQRFVVRILRRTDGKELVRYEYTRMREAHFHAASLRERMSSWDVHDLCAHLGIARAAALG